MSSFMYGFVNAQRQQAPAKKSKKETPPGISTWVDLVAALVPAEVLAINALLLSFFVSTSKENNEAVTKITEPGPVKLVFLLSILASILFYFIGDRTKKTGGNGEGGGLLANWNWLRALIPAVAYVLWTMLQKATAFDAVFPDVSQGFRVVVAIFAALVIGWLAKSLGDRSDALHPHPRSRRRKVPQDKPQPGHP
jgi:hypothetical protein